MRKIILMIGLAIVNGSAIADWVKVEDSNNSIISYIHPDTIHRKGSKATVWNLYDYKEPQHNSNGRPYMSMKIQSEFDCKKNKLRGLAVSVHTENMGSGKVLFADYDPQKWEPLSTANAIENKTWKIACNANPKWVEISRSNNSVSYANPDAIRTEGNLVSMWFISEWPRGGQVTEDGKPFMSAKIQDEYNCKQRQQRRLAYSLHSDYMGGGALVYSESITDKWESVLPNSKAEAELKFACKKR